MDTRIRELLKQITALEDELRSELHRHQTLVHFTIKGKRIEFENEAREMHRRLKRSFLRWLIKDRPVNLITGPVIYAMAIPLIILDIFVSAYQASCFPIYGIAKARRRDYIVFDRHRLGYLNSIERFHCEYCAYASGLIAYVSEITARTEQYFCPIKHAHRLLGAHDRYARFLDYGDAENYHARLEEFRAALTRSSSESAPS